MVLVQEINDTNRIKVNVNIFGRPTPIELSYASNTNREVKDGRKRKNRI